MQPQTTVFSLKRIFKQARQSNSKRGSPGPADPLVLKNTKDLRAEGHLPTCFYFDLYLIL